MKQKNTLAIVIGNTYEHYNKALFGLLAPFFAPLFFPKHSSVDSLIIIYAIFSLGIFFKPLGALFFGYIADTFGKKKSLFITLAGSSLVCLLCACTPTYAKIGTLAPVLLSISKALQSFFAAGETPVGALAALETTSKKSFMSSLYDASGTLGAFLASLGVYILTSFNIINTTWNILFFLGSGVAVIGLVIRKKLPSFSCPPKDRLLNTLKEHPTAFLTIFFTAGLSHALYYFSLGFFNAYLPLVSILPLNQTIKMNVVLLVLDILLLPFFGLLAQKTSKEKIMLTTSFLIIFLSCPLLLLLLHHPTPILAFCIRFIFFLFGYPFKCFVINERP